MNIGSTLWGVVGAGNVKHTHTHTHSHTLPRDTQDGLTLGQGSDTVLTHVRVARPPIKYQWSMNIGST